MTHTPPNAITTINFKIRKQTSVCAAVGLKHCSFIRLVLNMNRLIAITNFRSLLKSLPVTSGKYWSQVGVRTLLSSAYALRDEWSRRSEEPIIKNIKLEEYTYELDRRYNRDKKLSAIDVDLYAHKCDEESDLELLEEMVYRLRRCPNTIHTLPSTGHALVRMLLEHGKNDDLIRILDDRVNYGVFPNNYCYSLLMDTFLKQKHYTNAAKVASLLMLQEDFGNMLCKCLSLYSCHMYVIEPDTHPWLTASPDEVKAEEAAQAEEEEDEDERLRVDYFREPYFDDHFDLKYPKHVVGKTLAYLGKEFDGPVGRSHQLIGWAMYRKWDKVKDLTKQWLTSSDKCLVLEDSVKMFEAEIESVKDEERKTLLKTEFEEVVKNLRQRSGKESLSEAVKILLDGEIAKSEQGVIKEQKGIYESWAKQRVELLEQQIQASLREQIVKDIKEKKTDLRDQEELLYFFENFEKHALKLPPEFQPEVGPDEPLPKYRPSDDFHIVNVEEDYQHGLYMPPDYLREKFTEASPVKEEPKDRRKRR